MTVKQLIEMLEQHPRNARVLNGGDLYEELRTVYTDLDGDVILY